MSSNDILGKTETEDFRDNEYVSRTGQGHIGVQSDDAKVEDPVDPEKADTDEQLERDDQEAISKENIVSGRTRGAGKPEGQYQEPNDEDLLEDAAQKS